MPKLNHYITRARERARDFISSVYPTIDLHMKDRTNNKHAETFKSMGLMTRTQLAPLINTALKLSRSKVDLYGFTPLSYAPMNMNVFFTATGSTIQVLEHQMVFEGKEYPVFATTINLAAIDPAWNTGSKVWCLYATLLPGRGYVQITADSTFHNDKRFRMFIGYRATPTSAVVIKTAMKIKNYLFS